jgi:deoxycitidine kinase/deoxyguanosine kinase
MKLVHYLLSNTMMRPRIISIEGNIGAGKSTLVEELKIRYANRNDIVFLQEPVDAWADITQDGKTMLQLFYDNQKKYSFAFQVMAYMSRLRLIKNEVNRAYKMNIKTIVMERSLDADRHIFAKMLHADGMIEECMFKIYEQMSDDGLREYSSDGTVWLTASPKECLRRIGIRGREGEQSIGLDYLEKCDLYHQEWLGNVGVGSAVYKVAADDEINWMELDRFLSCII